MHKTMITLTREEAQQVLDALEDAADHIGCPDDDDAIGVARRTLRTRLAQPEPEPVAWQGVHDQTDLYYRKPLQANCTPLYTAPPPREWQGLTDEEIDELAEANLDFNWKDGVEDFARAVEAKLKEKNT